jgi:hypothetical protein
MTTELKAQDGQAVGSSELLCHDHSCHCGTGNNEPHEISKDGCVRLMEESPVKLPDGKWLVHGHAITDFTLRQQRGYHRHTCGCWSRSPESTNSIEA